MVSMNRQENQQPDIEQVSMQSADVVAERIEQLRDVIPEAFSEDKIDFDKLRTVLGENVDDGTERYSFSWAGKRNAIRLLQTPSRATLIPSPEESIDWDSTQNLFIEGDNLEVLKLLYKSYAGRVKMIYIDPPYNTGNDFIYRDNFADPLSRYLQLTGQTDEAGNLLTSNPETSGRYHSTWLSMMYPRLFIARQLLCDNGVIFISIDDGEVHNLRQLMNEVFGEENFIATVLWQKVYSPKNSAKHFSEDHDYILVYARNAEIWRPQMLPRSDEANARYRNLDNDPRGPWKPSDMTARNYYSKGLYEVTSPSGKKFTSGVGRYWRQSFDSFKELDEDNQVWWGANGDAMPQQKRFLKDVQQGMVPQTIWFYQDVGHTQEAKQELIRYVDFKHNENVLNTVKPTRLIQRMLQIGTAIDKDDIILDFFAGSGVTAHAVFKQNRADGGCRRVISVQLPEPLPTPEKELKTISDIATQRLRKVITEYAAEEQEDRLELSYSSEDLGFCVFKLAESHYSRWSGTVEQSPDELANQMEIFNDALLPGWELNSVIYEVLLKEGYSLTSRLEKLDMDEGTANDIYRISDTDREQSFLICLDDEIDPKTPRALELSKEDLFICRDVALNDELAANLALQCRLKTI